MANTEKRRLKVRNQRILKRRYEGYSITELARRFGLTPSTIRYVLVEIDPFYGKEIPKTLLKRQMKNWLTAEKRREITSLLGPTPSPNELARNYGISRVLSLYVSGLLRNRHEKFLKREKSDKMMERKLSGEKAKRMFEAGASKRFISRRFGISRKSLSLILRDE